MTPRRRPGHRAVVVTLLASCLLSACGADGDAPSAEDEAPPASIAPEETEEPTPTEEPIFEELFPAESVNDFTLTDSNGYEANIHQELSKWVTLTPEQAVSECGADELTYLDEETVVYARRLSVTAEFPETDFGNMGDGGSSLIAFFNFASDPSAFFGGSGIEGLVTCRPNHILPDDYYGQAGKWGKWLFDLMPATPDANVTIYIPVTKTPSNPDGELLVDPLPGLGSVVGAHGAPSTIQDGMTTGRADIFEDYTKFGEFGDLDVSSSTTGAGSSPGPGGGTF